MAQFTVNAQRFDPYKNFKFRVKWDGKYVAGVSKVSALKRTTEVVEHREGGDPSTGRKSPGRIKYEPITLERGVTHDTEFEKWASKVWNYGSGLGAESSLKDFRKDIIIEMYNEAGQLAIAYKVYRCWVSEYQAQPDLNANANAVAIQSLKLENEGWERDNEVTEPAEEILSNYTTMQPLSSADLLNVWEQGATQPVFQRALLLLATACCDESFEALTKLSIGQRDSRLFKLREWAFGSRINALTHCPACNEQLEFACDIADVCRPHPHDAPLVGEHSLRVDNYEVRFRLPNSLDLISLANNPSASNSSAGHQFLLNRCVDHVSDHNTVSADSLPLSVVEATVAHMARSDPQADVRIAMECPMCRHAWQADFDIVSFFWSEICAWANRLLQDVHSLAKAYGWSESYILALSHWRRQRYLAMVHA